MQNELLMVILLAIKLEQNESNGEKRSRIGISRVLKGTHKSVARIIEDEN